MKRFFAHPEDIQRLYDEGNSLREIAIICGVNAETIRRYCHRVGIKLRKTIDALVMGQKKRRRFNNWHPGSYRGGRYTKPDGYVLILMREHPNANPAGYVYEHRLVAEQKVGRPLNKSELVHHLNGNPSDNRLENLFVTNRNNHDTFAFRKALQKRIRDLEQLRLPI